MLLHDVARDEMFVLDPDAQLLFEALKEHDTVESIKRFIRARGYASDPDVDEQIERALEQMIAEGLLQVEP